MIVLTMAEGNFPLPQFFAAFSVKLQATVTRSTDVISEDISHVVQHANNTSRNRFGWWGTVIRTRRHIGCGCWC